ncbi:MULTISPECIES: ParB/RepB/Spo0J family partition protein [Rhodopirellula]|uniref:ParB-like partition protein n=5 Tax=Rhodopirellula TaxID=265488 RepID=L7CJW6_RHOBT|nr:ParB/RepB/Spo0J family partition protein [Rhodopirellula baltica]ELP34539.1 parB-like partition protein [Rhodopirellula baltica SWK14]
MSKADSFTFDNSDFRAPTMGQDAAFEIEPRAVGKRRMMNVAKIDLNRIVSRPQVRETFDEGELQELADSLASKGQQQPIRVWWDANEGGDGRYIILMGERRYRAAKMAGFTELEAVIHEGALTDADITELQLIENLIRADLNPVEEARAFRKIMDDRAAAGLPATAKDIAKEIGLSDTKVQRSVKLLKLPAAILEDVATGDIPPSLIRQMWRLPTEAEQAELIERYKAGESFGAVSETVKIKTTGRASNAPRTKKSVTIDGIKIEVTAKKKVTQAEIATAMKQWIKQISNDGRSKAA